MKLRAYFWIALTVLAGALVVGVLPRAPRTSRTTESSAPASPTIELTLVWNGTELEPVASEIALGRNVRATLENRGTRTVSIALAGYEDRVRIGELAAGARRTLEFTADRPGEAFAWTVNGEAAGRLVVVGSHLVEGHR